MKSFYDDLASKRNDSPELQNSVKETLDNLKKHSTTNHKPGMLLGKIQSGKTRAYLGIIAKAFDENYDIAIVFQKGTKALSEQTIQRIRKDFAEFIENDYVQVFDIMSLHDNLTKWELDQKMIIVAKKQKDNLSRLIDAFTNLYPSLKTKNTLFIDDEADFASICFRTENEKIEQGKISKQIDELRALVENTNYLQVTATPYSLYLQPEENNEQPLFLPKRPSFTVLLPSFPGYVGGDDYFEQSEDEGSICSLLFEQISDDERDMLKKEDRRSFKIEDVLSSHRIAMLRKAILNFIVGASIRRIQQEKDQNLRQKKYSFIIHTEQSKNSHSWQLRIIEELRDALKKGLDSRQETLDQLIESSFTDISLSVRMNKNLILPSHERVFEEVKNSIREEHIMICKVNSEKETKELLDEKGQLKLRAPYNIFVGGLILDRGITVENLIGFYYGRNPKRSQQDTVLQHSRMYGARTFDDFSVTRFYSTFSIFNKMKKIHEFDNELRKVLENNKDESNQGVYFIQKDEKDNIIPCSPNKIMLSDITVLKPFKRLLPIGFQTGYKSNIKKTIDKIDALIDSYNIAEKNPGMIDLKEAIKISELINYTFDPDYQWDLKSFIASMEYLSINISSSDQGKVLLLVRKNRNISRIKEDGGFSDSPDTPKTEGLIARTNAIDTPMLMLFRQNGLEENGWRGSPFWWPVLYAPKKTKTTIFANEVASSVCGIV